LNLRDSGLEVIVGARAAGESAAPARARVFEVLEVPEAPRAARVIAVLLPDETVPDLWPAIAAASPRGATVVFAHGFNLLYGALSLPPEVDVVLVSPTGPGRILRERFLAGSGLPAYLAVAKDASGKAWAIAEAYAGALGS